MASGLGSPSCLFPGEGRGPVGRTSVINDRRFPDWTPAPAGEAYGMKTPNPTKGTA